MSKIRELLKSPHIKIALATAVCIIGMAYFSQRVLPRQIETVQQAIPPFIMAIYEAILIKNKGKKIAKPWYWVVAVFLVTFIIIVAHAI